MKYARVIDDVAVDVCDADPAERFHPNIAASFVEVPDHVLQGMSRDEEGEWIVPPEPEPEPEVIVEPPAPAAPKVGPMEFKLLWTSAERRKLKSLRVTDEIIDDFFEIVDDPRLDVVDLSLKSTQDAISYCVQILEIEGVVDAGEADNRKAEIFSGVIL